MEERPELKWGETNLRSPRQPRSSRVLWPTCLQPLTSKPGHHHAFRPAMHPEPPSLWEPSGLRRTHKHQVWLCWNLHSHTGV